MALLNAEALAYIGRSSEFELACDAVEAGAVRRYAQAIMDDDPAYAPPEAGGGGLAPLLYPTHLFRRAWGTPDPIQDHASDPDFDGVADGIGATACRIGHHQGNRLASSDGRPCTRQRQGEQCWRDHRGRNEGTTCLHDSAPLAQEFAGQRPVHGSTFIGHPHAIDPHAVHATRLRDHAGGGGGQVIGP